MENVCTLLVEDLAGLHCQIGIGNRMPGKGLSLVAAAERAPIGSAQRRGLVDENLRMSFHNTENNTIAIIVAVFCSGNPSQAGNMLSEAMDLRKPRHP